MLKHVNRTFGGVKNMRAIRAVAVSILLVMSGTHAFDPAIAQSQRQVSRTVLHDTETLVAASADYWSTTPSPYMNCVTEVIPEVSVVSQPQHGTVRFDVGEVNTPDTKVLQTQCPNPFKAARVYYRPTPGFTGTDQFTYRRKGSYRTNGVDLSITVNVVVQ